MTLPLSYLQTLLATIASLLLMGSWINTLKLAKKWRFELYYFDFAIGAAVAAAVAAFTLGTLGADGFVLTDDLMRAGKRNMAFAVAAGGLFNLGNMLLVGASTIAGISIAFPVGLGLALLITVILGHVNNPAANATMLFTAVALLGASLVAAILSHRSGSLSREIARMKAGEHRTLRPSVSWRGILLSAAGGIMVSVHLPLVAMAQRGDIGVGPYSTALLFAGGVLFSTVVYNLFFMNLPISGKPVDILDYVRGKMRKHLLGLLGGAAWASGAICWLVVNAAPEEAGADRPLFFALAGGVPVVAALWGSFAWKELVDTDARTKAFLFLTLFLISAGLVMLTLSGFAPAR